MKKLIFLLLATNILTGAYAAGAYQARNETLPPADIIIPMPKEK
jgi:hypothetical protein